MKPGLPKAPFPALRAWLNAWLESPLFQDIMEKVPPWQEEARSPRPIEAIA